MEHKTPTPPEFKQPTSPQPPKMKSNKKKGCLMAVFIVLGLFVVFAIIGAIVSDDEAEKKENQTEVEAPMTNEERIAYIKQRLENANYDMDSIENHYKTDTDQLALRGNVMTLKEIADQEIWDSTYMDVYELPEISSLMEKNSARAKKLLPAVSAKARTVYADYLRKKLWENNIDVETTNGGTTIIFIGGIFANNKNIKDWQIAYADMLKEIGFKRVEYKWIRHAPEYTYYNL